jgi:hypothetical protein
MPKRDAGGGRPSSGRQTDTRGYPRGKYSAAVRGGVVGWRGYWQRDRCLEEKEQATARLAVDAVLGLHLATRSRCVGLRAVRAFSRALFGVVCWSATGQASSGRGSVPPEAEIGCARRGGRCRRLQTAVTEAGAVAPRSHGMAAEGAVLAGRRVAVGLCCSSGIAPTGRPRGRPAIGWGGNFDESG